MRKIALSVAVAVGLLHASASQAADLDYDVLRGTADDAYVPPVEWGGVYVGGHGGYSSASYGFGSAGRDIIANVLRRTTIEQELQVSSLLRLGDVRADGASYGAFAGYNLQLDDVVVGIEADYTRFDVEGTSSDFIGRQAPTSNGFQNYYNLSGISSTKVRDYGTLRARAGYVLDNFMPFATAGLAIGRAQISDGVGIQTAGYDATALRNGDPFVNNYGYTTFNRNNPGANFAAPEFYGRTKTKVVGGIALGGGLEYAITPNFLLRGEYQYVLFNDFDGHKVNINTVRGGAAVKF